MDTFNYWHRELKANFRQFVKERCNIIAKREKFLQSQSKKKVSK